MSGSFAREVAKRGVAKREASVPVLARQRREVSREVAKLTATKRRWNTVWAAELDEEVKTL